jgi:integrase
LATWWLHGRRGSRALQFDGAGEVYDRPNREHRVGPRDRSAFIWDSEQPALGLRVTAADARSFIFESKLDRRTIRTTIGSPPAWSLPAARAEAGRLKTLVDQGKDPRAERAETIRVDKASRAAEAVERRRQEVTGAEAWARYCEEGRRHGFRRGPWSALHCRDHLSLSSPGGLPLARGKGKTQPGPLAGLLANPLAKLDAELLAIWLRRETAARPTRAALAYRLLRAFLNRCAEHAEYGPIVDKDAIRARKVRDKLARPKAKADALQREQIAPWFSAVLSEPNLVVAAYLQSLLLTGARPEEWMQLRWADVDFRWRTVSIRDKVEGQRSIPLTPYVENLLSSLPRTNEWLFSSVSSKSGRLQDPRHNHARAVKRANLPHLTLHGLRRSFGSLSEWVECPVGVVAQLQGHKPSATVEKHYRVRPMDLLRGWHEKIERWIVLEASSERLRKQLRRPQLAA